MGKCFRKQSSAAGCSRFIADAVFCSVAVSTGQVIKDCMMTACLLVLESLSRKKKSFLPQGLMGAVMSGRRYVKHSTLCPPSLACVSVSWRFMSFRGLSGSVLSSP